MKGKKEGEEGRKGLKEKEKRKRERERKKNLRKSFGLELFEKSGFVFNLII